MHGKQSGVEERPERASLSAPGSLPPCKALQQFFSRLAQMHEAPYLLLLGEICGSNVNFLGERGFRVCLEKDVRPRTDGIFGGALLWDTLSLMPKALARTRASVLHGILAPGAPVLAFFGPQTEPTPCTRSRFRILSDTVVVQEKVRGRSATAHPYQNREIVQLFDRFEMETLQLHRSGRRDALFYKGRGRPGGDPEVPPAPAPH
jgi:hypothetical protein